MTFLALLRSRIVRLVVVAHQFALMIHGVLEIIRVTFGALSRDVETFFTVGIAVFASQKLGFELV